MPFDRIPQDLSRSVEVASPRGRTNSNDGFTPNFIGRHPHGAAQIRRGLVVGAGGFLGVPRFSPYRAREERAGKDGGSEVIRGGPAIDLRSPVPLRPMYPSLRRAPFALWLPHA